MSIWLSIEKMVEYEKNYSRMQKIKTDKIFVDKSMKLFLDIFVFV